MNHAISRYSYSRNGEQGRVDEKCLVRVQIPTVDSSNGGKVRYHVRVTNVRTGQAWEVARRFSEFLSLRNELIAFFAAADKKCPGCKNYEKVLLLFEFPRKHVFSSVTPVVINYRKKALRSFVALLASHTFTTTPKCPTCSGFPFTGVRDWLTMEMVAGKGDVGAVTATADGSPTHEAIRESMNVKDFTNYHPVSRAAPVDHEGRFTSSGAHKQARKQTKPVKKSSGKSHRNRNTGEQKQESPVSPTRSSDGASSTASSSNPPSPPSAEHFAMPTPAPVAREKATPTHVEEEHKAEDEDEDEEAFSSFVMPSSGAPAAKVDQPSGESPAGDNAARPEAATKKHFKFTRSSSARASMELRDSSMIDLDSDEDDDDEDVNLDFMSKASLAPAAST
ncbi:hypothetical protein BBJ28_00004096 [Nothophytophthora sp. Chile5]|nr:hypothetical protein BBJ28_00004096 [Nothophytophthora sp. Chile5]